jgi:hypothetical protein
MANDHPASTHNAPREIDLLLFHVAGVNMAVCTAQVDSIIGQAQAEQRGISSGMLNEILGMSETISRSSSNILLFRDGEETYGIGIGGLDSILPVKIGMIQLLPEILSCVSGTRPFWGVLPRGNDVVLLMDLYRLKGLISQRAETAA